MCVPGCDFSNASTVLLNNRTAPGLLGGGSVFTVAVIVVEPPLLPDPLQAASISSPTIPIPNVAVCCKKSLLFNENALLRAVSILISLQTHEISTSCRDDDNKTKNEQT